MQKCVSGEKLQYVGSGFRQGRRTVYVSVKLLAVELFLFRVTLHFYRVLLVLFRVGNMEYFIFI